MATFKNGILTGKLGKLIICNGKNGPYLRTAPRRRAPITEGERQNRFIFRMVQQWLKPLTPFLRLGFRGYSMNTNGTTAAISMMYKTGLLKNGYASLIDASQVKLSHGNVGLAENFALHLDADRKLHFSWDPEADRSNHPRDRILLLAYNVDAGEAAYDLSGPQRFEGRAVLDLSLMPLGVFHVYAAFLAANGEGQSDSKYLGSVEVRVTSDDE